MIPTPEKVEIRLFNEIIDELNNILAMGRADEFSRIRNLSKLEDRAMALDQYSMSLSFSALGSIAAARGSLSKMHEYHKRSIQYGKPSSIVVLNYAVSLQKVGLLQDAFALAESVHHANPSDRNAINFLVDTAWELGDESFFLLYADLWKKLTGEAHPLYAGYNAEVAEAKRLSKICTELSAPRQHLN